jgi:RNA polymerase sigma-70 factor (ECF subfamily)
LAGDLFEQHSEMVLSVCRAVLADPAEAEDAMQQTFLYAYRSIVAGSEPRRPAAWLATIARHECLNRLRARTREPHTEAVSVRASGAPDALNAAIAREDLHALGRTIRELPAQQREALLLHEFCGLPYSEVAATIGVTESAIGSLLFRARIRLRAALRRTYAALPIPTLWNAVDHLLARGPAAGVAPVVAKLGTAAIAVGLTTGAAIVVEQNVESHPSPPAPPARSSASPAPVPTSRTHVSHTAIAAYAPRVSRPSAAPPSARGRGHMVSRTTKPHPSLPARAATTGHASRLTASPAPLQSQRRSDMSSQTYGRSSQTPGHVRHGAPTSSKGMIPHGHGKALGQTRPPTSHKTKPTTTTKPKPNKHATSRGPASSSVPATDAHGNSNVPPDNGSPNEQAAPGSEAQQQGNGAKSASDADHGNGHAHEGR